MIAESNSSDRRDSFGHCPIPMTHRRLAEAHLLWHQTLNNYQDPTAFRANLNATIEALRNVTFVLQNEKSAFPKFDEWYGPWQSRLKADPTAKWLHDARTTVVHQGELESHSTAKVRLVTYKDEVLAELRIPVETPPSAILERPELHGLLEKIRANTVHVGDAAITIERRWSAPGLGDLEILEGLSKVYGLLSDIVLDSHVQLKRSECISPRQVHPDFRAASYRTGTLECMTAGPQRRTQAFKFSTGESLSPRETLVLEPYDAIDVMEAAKRYGIDEAGIAAPWETLDPVRMAERTLSQAKKVLRRDKYHQRIMFIRDSHGEWHMKALLARDRTEKYLLVRSVAQFVESKSCDAIVEVGEMWAAPAESVPDGDPNKVQNAKGRGEFLFVIVATREGIFRTYMTPFTRGLFGGIKLGETSQSEDRFAVYYLQPIFDVWRRQGWIRLPDGKALPRVWEPDPLDICFCGGPKRFGECCQVHIPPIPSPHSTRSKINDAINVGKFDRAEELARAALAQYVIWIKQHTAITMHVAEDLHRELANIDVLALESHVDLLEDSLEANGHEDMFVPQLRNLANVIGVPRISMRIVALTSRWLLRKGRIEEAILELDTLGDLDKLDITKLDDTLALVTIADVCDLSAERKEQMLRRAAAVAACKEEEWFAKFELVEHGLHIGKRDEALTLVDSVILESRSSGDRGGGLCEALLLRWRITKSESDFGAFKAAIESCRGVSRRKFAGVLIDEGLFADAEELLIDEMNAGDLVAKLLVVDARTRGGRADSARDLFLSIGNAQIRHELQYLYAVISAQLALNCKDEKIREGAILSIRQLPATQRIDEDVRNLFVKVQSEDFTASAPTG